MKFHTKFHVESSRESFEKNNVSCWKWRERERIVLKRERERERQGQSVKIGRGESMKYR